MGSHDENDSGGDAGQDGARSPRRLLAAAVALFAACAVLAGVLLLEVGPPGSSAGNTTTSLPPGVLSPTRACRLVLTRHPPKFFTRVEQVHLVLTTYARGEPLESQGDLSKGMAPTTLVWVVEVHAKAVNWEHSVPPGYTPPKLPYTDFSVVMNARSGAVTDAGESRSWPLPLWKVGKLVRLPASC